ncbi:MAG: tetratricopeptide repeat protein, partial [Acidobacteria bacterium]|nr:tetratricopeptide repeat protein [Acidobacteriota bacterium]
LEKALEIDPHFAEARAWYGFTHLLKLDGGESNDTAWIYKAEEELRRALEDDPHCARAHSALAGIYLYQGRKELIPAEAEMALKTNPREVDAPIWLAVYHHYNGDDAQAMLLLKELRDRDPLFFVARMNYADLLRIQGDSAGAVREVEKVFEQDPQNVYGIQILTRVYLDTGNLAQARQTLDRARRQDRANLLLRLSGWSLLLALEGKRAAALKEMDGEVLKYAAAVPGSTANAAEFYAILGDEAKALDWLERAVRNGDERDQWFRRDPLLANVRNHPRFQQILASIADRRQRRAEAGPLAGSELPAAPGRSPAAAVPAPGWLRYGPWVLTGLLLAGAAVTALLARRRPTSKAASEAQKSEAPAGKRLSTGGRPSSKPEANEYFEQGIVFLLHVYDLERPRRMWERALEIDPHFAEARGWYGFTHVLMVDAGKSNDPAWLNQGVTELQRALQDDPDCAIAHSALATAYYYQGRPELMRSELDAALKVNPHEHNAIVQMGVFQLVSGNYAEAEAPVKQALERDPAFFPARVFYGEVLRHRGDVEGAIREGRRVLDQVPN